VEGAGVRRKKREKVKSNDAETPVLEEEWASDRAGINMSETTIDDTSRFREGQPRGEHRDQNKTEDGRIKGQPSV